MSVEKRRNREREGRAGRKGAVLRARGEGAMDRERELKLLVAAEGRRDPGRLLRLPGGEVARGRGRSRRAMVALVGGIGWIGSGGIPRESGGGARVGSLEIRWFV